MKNIKTVVYVVLSGDRGLGPMVEAVFYDPNKAKVYSDTNRFDDPIECEIYDASEDDDSIPR